jgi:RNA polymerase sigma factor (sigma-70 family)
MVTTHTDTIGTDVPRLLEGGRGTAHDRRKRETAALWARVSGSAREDERARLREQIVLVNMSLAHAVARRYASRGISLEDLEQVACLGLVKAVRGFDPGVGKDFVSYASPTVSGEVKRHFRDLGWMVRPPRRVQDLQARINSLVADSAPSQAAVERPADIAEALGVDQAQVVEAMTCRVRRPRWATCSPPHAATTTTWRTRWCSAGPWPPFPPASCSSCSGGSGTTAPSWRSARRSASARCRCRGSWPGS